MRRRLVALALLSLSSACTAKDAAPIDVVFDPCITRVVAVDATVSELASVDRALALWNEAAGLVLVREPHLTASEAVLAIRFLPSLPALRGVYDDEVGEIVVNRNITDAGQRALTVAHELGHAFGLPHVPVERRVSLMNPGAQHVPPTEEDVRELHAKWGDCRGVEPADE